jgi:manganese-dependent inorganic pyrophosphatase
LQINPKQTLKTTPNSHTDMTQNNSNIYVIGHKSPDTDSVASAITASVFLNLRDKTTQYIPAITADVNTETAYILEKFNIQKPTILQNATDKKLFLVDHNEKSQIVDGADLKNILGFIDHHKIQFQSDVPLEIVVKPWGCTCTILYDLFVKERIDIPAHIKQLMLCALLSDTMILKSPTTTPKDKEVLLTLAKELHIDYQDLGLELLKAKAQTSSKSAKDIIFNDFKDFEIRGQKIGVGQIELPDIREIQPKLSLIIQELQNIKQTGYCALILMLTDVLKEGSELVIIADDEAKIAGMFKTQITNHKSAFIPGMLSRKKQVAPILSEKF